MTINEAMFILKHGSSEGITTYLQAIKVVEDYIEQFQQAAPEYTTLPNNVVEVVRCKDCKYLLQDLSERKSHICMQSSFARKNVNLDDYCSYGVRK